MLTIRSIIKSLKFPNYMFLQTMLEEITYETFWGHPWSRKELTKGPDLFIC